MKVLHISYSDSQGGAAIAAYRHHEAMRRAGIDSKMLVLEKNSADNTVLTHYSSRLNTFITKAFNRIFMYRYNFYASWSWNHFGYDLSKEEIVKDADIIYLHWINNYTISISSLEKILKLDKPTYWFMHDMWPITGGCHHSFECKKYASTCASCPMMFQKKGSKRNRDISFIQFNEKKPLSQYENLKFLTPSEWLANRVRESALFGNHDVSVSRNVLDTATFTIRNKIEVRNRLNLPIDKKLILFGADNISSPYKGWDILRNALKDPMKETECVLYGSGNKNIQSEIGMKVYSMGRISDRDRLIDIYNACDVFVTPSLADNYPNVLIEALACGLPVVASEVGGIPEIVENGINGKTIRSLNSENFRRGIIDVLEASSQYDKLAIRQQIIDKNSYETILIHHSHLRKL